MKIILLSGKAEAGKTSAAFIVQKDLESKGFRVAKLAYGDEVKEVGYKIFGWNGNKDEAGRSLLQWIGEKVREKYVSYWVDTITRQIPMLEHLGIDYLLVDDLRYANEVHVYDTLCWQYWCFRIVRPNHESKLTEEQRLHKSEVDLDNFDFDGILVAQNLDELETEVRNKIIPIVTKKKKG